MTKRTGIQGIAVVGVLIGFSIFAQGDVGSSSSTVSPIIPVTMDQKADLSLPAKTKIDSKLEGLVAGRNIDERYLKANFGLTELISKTNLQYNRWLGFDLVIEAFFVEGNARNFYTADGKSSDGFYLDEAAVTLKPLSFLELRGGVIETKLNPLQSIMNDMAFAGTTQKIEGKFFDKSLIVTLMGEEAVPSSGTVTKGIIDDSPNAFFLSQTLGIEAKFEPIKSKLKVAGTHYDFGNLSNNLAVDSVLIGNNPASFSGMGQGAQFIIGFGGFENAASFETEWNSKLITKLVGSVVQNNDAPSDRNYGTQAFVEVKKKFENFNIIPSFKVFRMGADIIPAAYTYLPYRYQNRAGFVGTVKFELEKEKVDFFASYMHGAVIDRSNPYMADRDMYTIGVEAKYDIL